MTRGRRCTRSSGAGRSTGPGRALEETPGQGRLGRAHRVGGLHRLHRLPGSPTCRRGPEKGDHDPGWTYPEGQAAEPDDHAIGRSRGGLTAKIHLAVDVLATAVTVGQRGDAPLFTELMNRIRVPRPSGGRPRTRPAHVLADRAYSSREIRAYLRRRRIPHTIPEKLIRPDTVAAAVGRPAGRGPRTGR
ncbi:transposase [Streptomyces sp. NPDC056632]|uniref:transposase n=1 Tax=Streptomyces sp. NPDC056632 TaxID=3345884 RepID=UPI0036C481D5